LAKKREKGKVRFGVEYQVLGTGKKNKIRLSIQVSEQSETPNTPHQEPRAQHPASSKMK
jgi:predicted RNA-binding protein with RPS1 domain